VAQKVEFNWEALSSNSCLTKKQGRKEEGGRKEGRKEGRKDGLQWLYLALQMP
jgi:hypothetical protein